MTTNPSTTTVPLQRRSWTGEQDLLTVLTRHRVAAPAQAPRVVGGEPVEALRQRLSVALEDGRAADAEQAARLLLRRAGAGVVHRVVASCLAAAGRRWADGECGVLTVRRQAVAARTLLERLRGEATPGDRGQVVLAVPPGERHTLALSALAHRVEGAGYRALVVEDLPLDELAEVAGEPGTVAVVLSVHVHLPVRAARHLLGSLRDAAPDVLLVAGGPGVPLGVRGADLVTDDADELMAALEGRTDPLTDREREVLLAVADGLTNTEVAEALEVSSATVKSHLDHVFAKTGTVHRAAAVAHALRQGWIR